MKKINVFTLILGLFFLTFFMSSEPVQARAYGWGYAKNNTNELPDVGKYGDVIKNYSAYYADFSGEKDIYLTFDNGYEQGYTEKILNVLKKEKVPATFFVTGHYVEDQPKLVQRMVRDGHIVGNHSYHHPDFTTLSKPAIKKELDTVQQAVANITEQKEMKYLRPPRGTFSEQSLKWTGELGYIHVFWSLAFNDWNTSNQKGWKYAYDQILGQIHPGAIILLHTVSSDNAEALEQVIIDLKKQGYRFKSLDDLVMKDKIPKEVFGL